MSLSQRSQKPDAEQALINTSLFVCVFSIFRGSCWQTSHFSYCLCICFTCGWLCQWNEWIKFSSKFTSPIRMWPAVCKGRLTNDIVIYFIFSVFGDSFSDPSVSDTIALEKHVPNQFWHAENKLRPNKDLIFHPCFQIGQWLRLFWCYKLAKQVTAAIN